MLLNVHWRDVVCLSKFNEMPLSRQGLAFALFTIWRNIEQILFALWAHFERHKLLRCSYLNEEASHLHSPNLKARKIIILTFFSTSARLGAYQGALCLSIYLPTFAHKLMKLPNAVA